MTTSAPNRYCQRLGLPVPDIDEVAARPNVAFLHLVVVALVERGGPMTVDEIAARIGRVALPARLARPDLRLAVTKAWHGQPPLVRDGDHHLALDVLSSELRHIEIVAGLRPAELLFEPAAEFRLPDEAEALSQDEVTAALSGRSLYAYSSIRIAAAVLEAWGGPRSLDEINARLRTLNGHGGRIDAGTVRGWRTDLVTIDPDGLFRFDPSSPRVGPFRRDIRRMAASRLRAAADGRSFGLRQRQWERHRADRDRALTAQAHQTRRALVHVVPPAASPRAAAVIDLRTREMRLFRAADLRDLAARLEDFDLLAGVDLRRSLRALGLDPERWLLAELRPVQRTFRPAERSAVPVTLPAAVQATTGIARIPADAATWQRLLDPKRLHDVAGRFASEARALNLLYDYGALHGGVRVRTRPGDSLLPVDWGLRGDPDLYSTLDAAMAALVPVDLVIGAPPDAADLWKHAVRADIVDRLGAQFVIRTAGQLNDISPADMFAVRVSDPVVAASIRRRHSYRHRPGVCRFTVTLEGIAPPIWRRLVVPAWFTLEKVHEVLQTALGWTNSHLHVFCFGDQRVGIPYELGDLDETYTRSGRTVELGDVVALGHRRMTYEYDFGDGWTHTIELEDVRDEDDEPGPRCVDGARACPPEDCGGVHGYHDLLEILFDPTHPEFGNSRRWVGAGFDPERFDRRLVNQQLARS